MFIIIDIFEEQQVQAGLIVLIFGSNRVQMNGYKLYYIEAMFLQQDFTVLISYFIYFS